MQSVRARIAKETNLGQKGKIRTGCPSLLQSDPGTENVIVGSLQSLFHKSDESFRIVRSTFNQRIEAWWSMLRRRFTTWWIDFFRDLASFGAFEMGNENDMRCVRVCFSYLVQKELDEVKESWNHHHISRSRQAVVPNGKPVLLFSTPEVYGAKDCLKDIDEDDFTWGCSLCPKDSLSGSYDFDNVASQTLLFKNWKYPASWKDCLENYFLLRDATTPNNNESIS
ncbi:hypothetical protein FSP39_004552 [Pinctada imbricata]|uniref:Integrase core domain-containing protein n=1 Tax=Pinctada imbricata TaxID=66713 RepID=A0AA88XL19_PINIB|nr:hypothetical protein FSP39_004552 [Pinctada imbricata]